MSLPTMQAVIHTRYGHPKHLKIENIKRPVPKEDEILVRIHASTVTPSDIKLRSGKFPLLFWLPVRLLFGIFRPRKLILGYELSGVVEGVGTRVSRFKQGDEIIAGTYWKMSAHSEYICIKERSAVIHKPNTLSFEEAAALPDGSQTALHFLRIGEIKEGDNVLIYGASGSVGSYAIQIANAWGAKVTAVCSSRNFEMVRSLGAIKTIDYTKEDYSININSYDVIFDAVGKSSFKHAKPALTENGIYLSTTVNLFKYLISKLRFNKKKQFKTSFAVGDIEKLSTIVDMVEEGKILPFIDRVYFMNDIASAHEYVETGRKRGNVVISVIPK